MEKSAIYWQTYLKLEKEAIELSKYIFFTDEVVKNEKGNIVHQSCDSQLATFSPHIADLLVRCCVEIEAISKELYYENGGTKPRGDSSIFFDEDCLKLIDMKWETHKKTVLVVASFFNFTKDENLILKPLREAHKRQGTYWERAYQAVKHDRFYSMHLGNVKAFIHALAALYLLNIYYRNPSLVVKYHDISSLDYSMGSSIFAVKPPVTDQLWKDNKPIKSDSPFVVRYKEAEYRRIEQIIKNEYDALNHYWTTQPELTEPEFMTQLSEAIQRTNPSQISGILYLSELGKYRINKKIPNTLTFEERKALLINSEEWNGRIHQHNDHLSADELTEDNIQHEIDLVGTLWGMEIMHSFQKLEWLPMALNSEICEILIPQ